MAELSEQGELAHLTAERVWMETEKALNEPHPEIYFETLHQVGALKVLFPEIAALDGVPIQPNTTLKLTAFIHTMLVLQQAVKLTENSNLNKSAVRFAAICHDLGKALTPKENVAKSSWSRKSRD